MAWILSQIAALDSADIVLAIGGKEGGAAELLLQLTTERRRPVLPFTFLGGVAASTFARMRYELFDRLGEGGIEALQDPARVDTCADMAGHLVAGRRRDGLEKPEPTRSPVVFISYPRARPAEADFVEMNLRRRNIEVIRDEHDFGTGYEVPGLISEALHRATLFIALWCSDYACSPWCCDELEMALDRLERASQAPPLMVAVLCLDETRVVPKRARKLLHHPVRSRDELLATVLRLMEQHAPAR
ncbi:toll/interleukin-1 receptor domain-containing protein [Corallococcus exercitus]|uniref:Toll/interleukin-1 receptor domain-containing protein n=1 Tax=Corallococcus exercitus TaxID=2316736 RepID=A0A7Y4KHL0_9BACT|nr:toll/interleukin-1 receptor domain-containing protein [Corallococcus exercitus]NOK33074.1 toll/interleukin-1 receptor domain-containing protein [Corallococcus exercitus]